MRRTRRTFRNDPDGLRLPVKLDTATNGEFEPIPLSRVHALANETAMREATRHARGLGISRREFLVSAAGTATALLAMNAAYAAAGNTGGAFALAAAAAKDPELARAQLGSGGFIFDVQGHFVDPKRAQGFLGFPGATRAGVTKIEHLGAEQFVKDVFLDSATDCMVLSFVPSTLAGEPLTIQEATACARIVEKLEGTRRLLIHGRVNPNQDGDLARMDELAERWKNLNPSKPLTMDIQIASPSFHVDAVQLRQIINHLLTFAAIRVVEGTVCLSARDDDAGLHVTVQSTGKKAIDKMEMDSSMLSFIAASLIKLHGGSMEEPQETEDGFLIRFSMPRG